MFSSFLDAKNNDMEPVRRWINKSGKIAYSPVGKLKQELENYPKAKTLFKEYNRRGKLRTFDSKEVQTKESSLTDMRSNDSHIIALAQVSKVKLLVSGDHALHEDFKVIVKGSVYQYEDHKHLLKPDLCP